MRIYGICTCYSLKASQQLLRLCKAIAPLEFIRKERDREVFILQCCQWLRLYSVEVRQKKFAYRTLIELYRRASPNSKGNTCLPVPLFPPNIPTYTGLKFSPVIQLEVKGEQTRRLCMCTVQISLRKKFFPSSICVYISYASGNVFE